jgi:hypothetical protein
MGHAETYTNGTREETIGAGFDIGRRARAVWGER